jgi:IS1 family transposase
MNITSRDKQIDIIAALTEGMSIRSVERLTGVHRDTIMRLGARVGRGCAELHDRRMVGLRVARLELDELWQYVGRKQKRTTLDNVSDSGDQWTFVALAASTRAIVSYWTGKRESGNTQEFIADLRERVIGSPEISTDGFLPYLPPLRDHFRKSAHGQIKKTYSVTDLRNEASHRYSPAAVIAVERETVSGQPEDISTSYVERSHLSIRMACRRFARLTNAFSKKVENHAAAVSLYVAHYNFCRPHESLTPDARHQTTPAMAQGIADHVWSIGELIDAALATLPAEPATPDQRRRFRVIQGGQDESN